MEFQLDPLAPGGISRITRDVTVVSGGGSLTSTDSLPEGTTNLYSQWESNTYGSANYLQGKTIHGIVTGEDLHSSVMTAFDGAAAIFNNTPTGIAGGVNYFADLAYGTGFTGFGALYIAGRAYGTAAAPTYVPADGYLGGYIFSGFDGTDWTIAGVNHTFPGLFGQAAADVTGGSLEADVWMGGLLTKMIGFETDTNAIKFNAAQLDSDITFYSDTGTTLVLDGGTTQAIFAAGTAAAPSITFTGDVDTGIHYVGANQFSFDTAGVSRMQISALEVVVNPGKIASNDFRVHGDTVDNLIFFDVSADSVTFGVDPTVPDEAYGSGWNGSLEVPTKNAVYDKIEVVNKKSVSIQVTDGTTNVTTGDGKAYFTIPEILNGFILTRAQATVVTAGTTNATTVMIHNKTDAQDMLSGAISIASAGTVGTVGTINTTYDDVATNDVIRIDVDSVSTTAPQGLMVVLEFSPA